MTDTTARLGELIAVLTYPGDFDEPFSVITWPAASTSRAAAETNAPTHRPIETAAVDSFFGELADDDQAARFDTLKRPLVGELTDVAVFRIGDGSEIDVYVIGRGKDGGWVGLSTRRVET